MKDVVTPSAWVALLAIVIGGLVRLVQTNALNRVLARFHLRPVPKAWLPWLALFLGVAASFIEQLGEQGVMTWRRGLESALQGLLAGAFAIAGHETLGKTAKRAKVRARARAAAKKIPPRPAARPGEVVPGVPALFPEPDIDEQNE